MKKQAASLILKEREKLTDLQSSQTSKMELFAKIVNGWKPLFIFTKGSILDLWLGSEYTSEQIILSVYIVCFMVQGYNYSTFKNESNLLSSSNDLRS